MAKFVTFGEIMGPLQPPGYGRIGQTLPGTAMEMLSFHRRCERIGTVDSRCSPPTRRKTSFASSQIFPRASADSSTGEFLNDSGSLFALVTAGVFLLCGIPNPALRSWTFFSHITTGLLGTRNSSVKGLRGQLTAVYRGKVLHFVSPLRVISQPICLTDSHLCPANPPLAILGAWFSVSVARQSPQIPAHRLPDRNPLKPI
jgi:hypothetical protein